MCFITVCKKILPLFPMDLLIIVKEIMIKMVRINLDQGQKQISFFFFFHPERFCFTGKMSYFGGHFSCETFLYM